MKLLTQDGTVIFQLESGIEVEIHGSSEALSLTITHTKQCYDVGLSQDGTDLDVDGWKLSKLIKAAINNTTYAQEISRQAGSQPDQALGSAEAKHGATPAPDLEAESTRSSAAVRSGVSTRPGPGRD